MSTISDPAPHRNVLSHRLAEALLTRALVNRQELAVALEHCERRQVPLLISHVRAAFRRVQRAAA